jgi:hypothetical protein
VVAALAGWDPEPATGTEHEQDQDQRLEEAESRTHEIEHRVDRLERMAAEEY